MMTQVPNSLSKNFVLSIEALVLEKGMSYMEALINFANTANVEVETVGALVKAHKVIEAKLQDEAMSLNLVARIPTLSL